MNPQKNPAMDRSGKASENVPVRPRYQHQEQEIAEAMAGLLDPRRLPAMFARMWMKKMRRASDINH